MRNLRQFVGLRTRIRSARHTPQSALRRLARSFHERAAPFRPKRYLTPDLDSASLSVLSADPPILYVLHWMDEEQRFMTSLDPVFEYLRGRSAYFLYRWAWNIDEPDRVAIVRAFEKQHRRLHRKHHFVHMCNTLAQYDAFLSAGLEAVFCNQNFSVDEKTFRPRSDVVKTFDAVYDARLKSYKRHFLASQVERLALIYDFNPLVDDPAEVAATRQRFADAHFFNHCPSGEYRRLASQEVNQCLNQCRVGLCLSKIEGAMRASAQYLLAGLPVVSTESTGGRDVFFDPEFTCIVEDRPEAVREGVQEMLRRRIAPDTIRAKMLDKVRRHRAVLINLVNDIYEREGVRRNFAAEWENVFFDRMVKHQTHTETIAKLRSDSASV